MIYSARPDPNEKLKSQLKYFLLTGSGEKCNRLFPWTSMFNINFVLYHAIWLKCPETKCSALRILYSIETITAAHRQPMLGAGVRD